ncbi:MAG TPA: hypothetical protein VE398_06950 [Acidobacteriota bacterium]|nr:hypothetical protein [Acidobacteriota bacterium]
MSRTRKAIEGEELVVQKFTNNMRWPTSPNDLKKAVCLVDGTMLKLNGIPQEMQEAHNIGAEAVVEFRQFSQRTPPESPFRDVLLFHNGDRLQVSQLPLGMRIDVLSPAVMTRVNEEEAKTIYVPRR